MNQTKAIPNIAVEDIDHRGIIAGIVDDIGIVEIINQRVGEHTQEQVSAGHVVKALISNCMGFLSAPLYTLNGLELDFLKMPKSTISYGFQPFSTKSIY